MLRPPSVFRPLSPRLSQSTSINHSSHLRPRRVWDSPDLRIGYTVYSQQAVVIFWYCFEVTAESFANLPYSVLSQVQQTFFAWYRRARQDQSRSQSGFLKVRRGLLKKFPLHTGLHQTNLRAERSHVPCFSRSFSFNFQSLLGNFNTSLK